MAANQSFYHWFGGRKNANALLFSALITWAYHGLDVHDVASLQAYAMWLAAAILGTGALHVIEDTKKGAGS